MENDLRGEILDPTSTRSDAPDGPTAASLGEPGEPRRRAGQRQEFAAAEVGTRIKHYEVLSILGQGGSAGVLLARDTRLGRLVALKIPRHRKNASVRLLAEARALARLVHENIVMIYDVGTSSGHPYMTLEYIKGRTLRELSIPGGIRESVALEVMIPVVRALAHAHERGVVHRDLKPQNIMIADAGPIKVLDFGLAEQRGASPWGEGRRRRSFRQRAPAGTLLYMSPEQLRAEDVDHRCDIWAVGIILHELITGRHPLAPLAPGGLRSLLDLDEPLPSFAPQGSAQDALSDVLRRCLKKRREERFRTTWELVAALEKIARDRRGVTWTERMQVFQRMLARASYHEYGSYAAAGRALRLGRRALARHANSVDGLTRSNA